MDFSLEVERPKIVWRQVAEQMRQKILSGKLPPGTKLPSTAELATQSGVDVKSIHRAMTELVREGLLTRTRKVGTHVTERSKVMSPIGIYYHAYVNQLPGSPFLQGVNTELQNQASERGITTRVWVDYRPQGEQTTILPEIEAAARDRHIQGLVATAVDFNHLKWLEKLKVPVSCITHISPTGVTWKISDFLNLSVRKLRKNGCKSAAVIMPGVPDSEKLFLEACAAHGVTTCADWTLISEPVREAQYEAYGYQAFTELWSKPNRPEALIVYPDIIAKGVILAAMAHQVRVPEDLTLILHKNEGVRLFCPLKAHFVVSSVRELAAALIDQLERSFRGLPCECKTLPFRVVSAADAAQMSE